jgi:hypothetical protein
MIDSTPNNIPGSPFISMIGQLCALRDKEGTKYGELGRRDLIQSSAYPAIYAGYPMLPVA